MTALKIADKIPKGSKSRQIILWVNNTSGISIEFDFWLINHQYIDPPSFLDLWHVIKAGSKHWLDKAV